MAEHGIPDSEMESKKSEGGPSSRKRIITHLLSSCSYAAPNHGGKLRQHPPSWTRLHKLRLCSSPHPLHLFLMDQELYVTSTKRQKMAISRSIVEAVRSLDPPGRFLEKNQETGLWSDIGDKKAIEKVSAFCDLGITTV